MKNTVVLIAAILLCCACMIAQDKSQVIVSTDDMAMQLPVPPPPPDGGAAPPNVFFRTQRLAGDKVTMSYFAVSDSKPVTGAPYSATAVTETTQVLSDGNRIVNKMESQLARDGQGRTRRQEMMSNIGPLATSAPKMAFINDPVGKVSYVLDLNDKTAQVIKVPDAGQASAGPTIAISAPHIEKLPVDAQEGAIQKRMIIAGGGPGGEQRVWVNNDNPSAVKTESLGTQTVEGVPATGTRTTRTIPAGEIGNERPLEITSEVWTSPDLQMVVMSKRNDPRIGETVYKLTNLQRAEPDPSLFQVPSGFTTKQEGGLFIQKPD
jgi:hypothetical protein